MKNTKTLTRVALLVAIELVMKLVGLGSVPMGPLYMSFLTLPIAVGAITMGPAVGALLGGVFGAVSFYDAITGASAMTGALFQVSPVNTFILCVGMRVLILQDRPFRKCSEYTDRFTVQRMAWFQWLQRMGSRSCPSIYC